MSSNGEYVQNVLGLWDAGRIDDAVARLAPDVEFRMPLGIFNGRDEVAGLWDMMSAAFSDRRHTITRTFSDGDVGVVCGSFAGTNSGPLGLPDGTEVPASGRRVEQLAFCNVVEFEAGLPRTVDVYFDNLDFMAQLGLVPEPAQA